MNVRSVIPFAVVVVAATAQLDIKFEDDAGFRIYVAGDEWLGSAPIRAFASGVPVAPAWCVCLYVCARVCASACVCSAHCLRLHCHLPLDRWRTLNRTGTVHSKGSDTIGAFTLVNVSWISAGAGAGGKDDDLVLHTSLKVYGDGSTAIFIQQLPMGATGTNASNPVLPQGVREMDPGNYDPVVSFPALSGGKLETLGYLTWQSRMVNAESGTNVTRGPGGQNEPLIDGMGLQGLSTSGPVVLFDPQFNSLVIAPMDNFKSVVHHVRGGTGASATWDTGVSSELTSLPPGFEHRTLLVAGRGITATLDAFGRTIRMALKTNRRMVQADPNLQYLSYWTDNGAYNSGTAWAPPWGGAGGGGTEVNEAGLRQTALGLKDQGLLHAVKSWQLDDWWYMTSKPQGGVYSACVANWTLPSATFPSGLRDLSKALTVPWLLYVPFWCPENVYKFEFEWIHSFNPDDPTLIFAEPHPSNSEAFYAMLFDYGIGNGMGGFEHDYLDYNYLAMPYLRKTHGAATEWLAGINAAAVERSVPVQICMALPSDLMSSLNFHSMTNYR